MNEREIYYNLKHIKNIISDSIILGRYLIDIVASNRNIDKLYNNYLIIKELIDNNNNIEYKLSLEEKNNTINYLNNEMNLNWWGKKDIEEKGIETGYNDEFIWREVIKFSKKNKSDLIFLTSDKKDFKGCNLKEDMTNEFHVKTGYNIKIINLEEYDFIKEIEREEIAKDKLELFIEKEFSKNNEVDDVINEGIQFIEYNAEEFSLFFRENSDWLDELFDDDYEEDKEYVLAVNALTLKLGDYYDFEEEVNLECKFYKVNDNNIVFNIMITVDLASQLECIIKYEAYLNTDMKIKFNIKDVDFDISGEKFYVKSDDDINQVMLEKYCFKDYIEPIIKII